MPVGLSTVRAVPASPQFSSVPLARTPTSVAPDAEEEEDEEDEDEDRSASSLNVTTTPHDATPVVHEAVVLTVEVDVTSLSATSRRRTLLLWTTAPLVAVSKSSLHAKLEMARSRTHATAMASVGAAVVGPLVERASEVTSSPPLWVAPATSSVALVMPAYSPIHSRLLSGSSELHVTVVDSPALARL
jgi:hypothetical protein